MVNFFREPASRPKKLAAIIDIDGTVALSEDRSWNDYEKVRYDRPRHGVIGLIKPLIRSGRITPVYVTGRPMTCRTATREWLESYMGHTILRPEQLVMRPEGDYNANSEYKRKVYETLIAPVWDVVAVFEDNPKAAQMYRSFGLEVFQVFNEQWSDGAGQ